MIYDRIKKLADDNSMSIRELEKELGYSNGTIRKWLYSAPSKKLSEVANFFGVSSDYLIGRENISDSKIRVLGRRMSNLSSKQQQAINSMIEAFEDNNNGKK